MVEPLEGGGDKTPWTTQKKYNFQIFFIGQKHKKLKKNELKN